MLHFTVHDIATAVKKNINYAILSAELAHEKNKKSSMIKPIVKIPYEFIRVYLVQLNFLNGYQGLLWSILSSFGTFMKYAKLNELKNQSINDL